MLYAYLIPSQERNGAPNDVDYVLGKTKSFGRSHDLQITAPFNRLHVILCYDFASPELSAIISVPTGFFEVIERKISRSDLSVYIVQLTARNTGCINTVTQGSSYLPGPCPTLAGDLSENPIDW